MQRAVQHDAVGGESHGVVMGLDNLIALEAGLGPRMIRGLSSGSQGTQQQPRAWPHLQDGRVGGREEGNIPGDEAVEVTTEAELSRLLRVVRSGRGAGRSGIGHSASLAGRPAELAASASIYAGRLESARRR